MTTELEDRLRADLHAVDAAPLDDSIGGHVELVLHRHRTRRRAGVTAACLALVGAGVVGIALTTTGDDDDLVPATTPTAVDTVPATVDDTVTGTAESTTDGSWRVATIAADPRGTVNDPAAVWTGTEIITTGGADGIAVDDRSFVDGGSAYDPAADRWRTISGPGALITDTGWQVVGTIEVWTGEDMLVLGDNERAARYDPEADSWSGFDVPVAGDVTVDTPHVWTGDEWLIWFDDGPRAYNPTTQTWRRTAEPPVAARIRAASVWSGSEWIVWGGRTIGGDDVGELGDGAAYDPATDTWRVVAAAPIGPRWVGGVWAGGEMFVQAGARGPDNGPFALDDGAAYDPNTDTWRTLAPGPAHPGTQAATSGTEIFAFFKNGVMVYDIATDTWDDGGGIEDGYVTGPVLWAADRLLVLGGTSPYAVLAR